MDNEERRRERNLSEARNVGGKLTDVEMCEYMRRVFPHLSLSDMEDIVRMTSNIEKKELLSRLEDNARFSERLEKAFPGEKTVDQRMM